MVTTDLVVAAIEKGLVVLPTVPHEKRPSLSSYKTYHSTEAVFCKTEALNAWQANKQPESGIGYICGQISQNLAVLDIETKGIEYRTRLEEELPSGVWEKISAWEERSAGGIHLYFRLPQPVAKQCVYDAEGNLVIELLCQGSFVVGAPTKGVHKKDNPTKGYKQGDSYEYVAVTGGPDTLQVLSEDDAEQLFELLHKFDARPASVQPQIVDGAAKKIGGYLSWAASKVLQNKGWETVLTAYGCKLVEHFDTQREYYEIPGGGAAPWGLVVNLDTNRLSCFAASLTQFADVNETRRTYDVIEVMAGFEFGEVTNEHCTEIAHREAPVEGYRDEELAELDQNWPTLPDEFYEMHPLLKQIQKEALARAVPPDSVLAGCLAHTSFNMDYRILLPGGAVNNLFIALVGKSGKNKGRSLNLAAALMPAVHPSDPKAEHIKLGSGEGISKAFYGTLTEAEIAERVETLKAEQAAWEGDEDADGASDYEALIKVVNSLGKTRHIVRRHCMMRIDEGETLEELGNRNGSTSSTVLRSAASGESLGFGNVGEDRTFPVPQYGYRLAVVMGIQPEKTKYLLDDSAGGTPQRFLWVATKWYGDKETIRQAGPTLSAPDKLPIEFPRYEDFRTETVVDVHGTSATYKVMTFAPEIEDEFWDYAVDNLDDTHDNEDELASQAPLNRRKIAATFAYMFGMTAVDLNVWHITKMFEANSDAVRNRMIGVVRLAQAKVQKEAEKRAANRAKAETKARLEVEERFVDDKVKSVALRIAKHVHEREHDCSLTCLKDFLGRDKSIRDEALEYAFTEGWVFTEQNGRTLQISKGASKPA